MKVKFLKDYKQYKSGDTADVEKNLNELFALGYIYKTTEITSSKVKNGSNTSSVGSDNSGGRKGKSGDSPERHVQRQSDNTED